MAHFNDWIKGKNAAIVFTRKWAFSQLLGASIYNTRDNDSSSILFYSLTNVPLVLLFIRVRDDLRGRRKNSSGVRVWPRVYLQWPSWPAADPLAPAGRGSRP